MLDAVGFMGIQASVLALQRHFRVLTKFTHVESQLSGRKRQREAVFYAPVNLCDRRPCSTSVAVGVVPGQQFGLRGRGLRKLCRQYLGNALMVMLPGTLEERLIRRLLDEGMLEQVCSLRQR